MNNLDWSKTYDPMSWNEAISLAEEKEDDWRLPTIKELIDCYDYENGKPKFEGFSDKIYWSSNANANYTSSAWYVNLCNGYVHYVNKNRNYHVRLVREVN